jgi:YidC/Oxa1 family membrane protein insertase
METLLPLLAPLSIGSALGSFFNTIFTPLYWAVSGILVFFHHIWSPLLGTGSGWNWALSIICLTVVIRIILIPLFVRQIHSSRKMQLLQPKIRELQKKYGHDRERLGQETMKLYREENANPMASCLPLLLQSPIFIALYRVLIGASQINPKTGLPTAHGYWLERDPGLLTSLNRSEVFGARLADKFWPVHSLGNVQLVAAVMIVIMTATMFYTQLQLTRKNMPKEAMEGPMAQQQKMMLYLFPLIFVFMGVNIPIGVLFYWVTSQLWTMGQQYYVIRNNPLPGTDAYTAWEERQRRKGLDPREVAAQKDARANGRPKTAATSGSVVGRQSNGSAAANGAADGAVNGNGQSGPVRQAPVRQQPVRQQPRRQPRSQRKN